MKATKKFNNIALIIMILLVVLVACTPVATATPEANEQMPVMIETSTSVPEPTATEEIVMVTEPETVYPSDPVTWDLSDSIKQVDEYGYTSYILEDWQVNLVLTTVIESFNTLYIDADHIVTPDEMEQYYDTEAPAWIGSGDDVNMGFLGQYNDNVAEGVFTRFSYPISQGNEAFYTNWKAWAVEPPTDFNNTPGYTRFDKFTTVVQFRMEETPLYIVNEANQVVFENTYWGPMILTYYLQYSDGQWKIVEEQASDLGTYDPTSTPGQD